MEINVVELIVQAGALGALVVLLVVVGRYGSKVVDRLMDNLDQQTQKHEASVKVQTQLETSLRALCQRFDDCDVEHDKRAQETVKAQAEVANVLTNLGDRLETHETRAQKRHEQQSDQSSERHAELIGVLRHLNGK